MTNSGFHVYFWRLLIFRWILYKADISIKRTLLSCTNGVHFIEIPLWLGGRGCSKTNKGKQAGSGAEVKTRESWANVLFECSLMEFTKNCAKNSLWSEIPRSIIPELKVFSVEFVRVWSIRVGMLHVTRVGNFINCFKE